MNIRIPTLVVFAAAASTTHADLLVGNLHGDNVLRYSDSGSYLGVFASGPTIDGPQAVGVGPDGNVYIGSEYTHNVTKWSPTGTFLGEFTHPSGPGSQDLEFGPDGNLYLLPHGTTGAGPILKYALDGTFLGFVGDAATSGHTHGLAWGPDGNLYSGNLTGPPMVMRINGITGTTMGPFVTDPNLATLADIEFGPDGNLYASNVLSGGMSVGGLYRYNGVSGSFMGTFSTVGAAAPTWGITFKGGDVYYAAGGGVAVVGPGGGLASAFVTPGSGGLTVATGIAFLPPVPEPGTVVALMAGLATLKVRRRR